MDDLAAYLSWEHNADNVEQDDRTQSTRISGYDVDYDRYKLVSSLGSMMKD